MKTLKWSLLFVLVTGVSVLTVMLHTRSPRTLTADAVEATETNERSQEAAPNEPVIHRPVPLTPVPARTRASVVALTPDKTDAPAADVASEPANVVRLRADQVLARVNDQAILLKDLVPLQPGEQEQAMTPEEYESRLNRAIEMELTFQTAAARGVDLTPEQKRRVDGIAQKHLAAWHEYTKQGVAWSSVTAAQVEFEQRLTFAMMLQQNLVALEAHVAPASDSGSQRRYEHARSEVLGRLKARGNVSISTTGI